MALQASRQRVNQESVDQMAELRRQGLTFKEIGARVGCSERTARRYAGRVEPRIQLPPATPEPVDEDPHQLREGLARWLSDFLYKYPDHPHPNLSVRFMDEAVREFRKALEPVDPLTLGLLSKDHALRLRFIRESIGWLLATYRRHIEWDANWQCLSAAESAAEWRPPRYLTPEEVKEMEENG
jgi:hypothetical protein